MRHDHDQCCASEREGDSVCSLQGERERCTSCSRERGREIDSELVGAWFIPLSNACLYYQRVLTCANCLFFLNTFSVKWLSL